MIFDRIFDLGHKRRQLRFSRAYVAANFPAINQSMGAVPVAGLLPEAPLVSAFLPIRHGAVA
jgi:hypothetical protein